MLVRDGKSVAWHGFPAVAVEEIHRCWLGDPHRKRKVSIYAGTRIFTFTEKLNNIFLFIDVIFCLGRLRQEK